MLRMETRVNAIARKRPTKTLSSLFEIESHFGKLTFSQQAGLRFFASPIPTRR
jgi:hypothetical protein